MGAEEVLQETLVQLDILQNTLREGAPMVCLLAY
jgi:hypothetical protein